MNWSWLLLRTGFGLAVFLAVFLSQRFWYRSIWRVTSNWRSVWLRVAVRLLYLVTLILIIIVSAEELRVGHRGRLIHHAATIKVVAGLWFSSALCSFVTVNLVRAAASAWTWLRQKRAPQCAACAAPDTPSKLTPSVPADAPQRAVEIVPDPSRRYFFRAATALAGAGPFLSAVYGFAEERLNYKIHRVEIPIANLPSALDGMTIAQLSDIHLSGYMSKTDVRRAVDMANDLGADLAVVTGDFITSAGDPLADCIDELRRLYAPLGVWGCNGNHEIYARAEDAAQRLFAQAGMKLLRQENAQVPFRGAQLNLIGVDYQRERTAKGRRVAILPGVESLVRRDMPNILLSHNPNSFNRAAELGIELSLAGHTHGGQIQVEILDHRLSPARFMTDYVAGLFRRPLFAQAPDDRAHPFSSLAAANAPASMLYVNSGLGTVGAPVRLGVPPEITHIVLRRA